ncbi:MAG: ABC transporter permease [Bacteroides sp.]|nr:ABC transporter permease [Bacteroides sp.]MCI1681989.1 ABC transporter permease [Bacteroides sp.]
MKFVLHNLRMIFSRFRSNGWVLAELFLVFIVLWFLCDSLGCMKYTFYKPLGYNINHVYQLSMIMGGESKDSTLSRADKYVSILKKLREEPTVEAACFCYWSLPMSGSSSYSSLAAADSVGVDVRMIESTKGYTRVFRMNEDKNHQFDKMPANDNSVILSEGAFDLFREEMPKFSRDTPLRWVGDSLYSVRQYGIIGRFRGWRYGADAAWCFTRLDENKKDKDLLNDQGQIVFRVKEHADGADYRSHFLKDIAPRLDTDNMFVADAAPFSNQQLQYEVMRGDVDKVNSQTIIAVFLLANVFLGLIGTFWLRTRKRRGEVALRLSMGCTRTGIFRMLTGEGLLLLTLAAVPAMVICYNIGISEFSIGRTELITTWPVKWSFVRFLLGSAEAWLLMASMVVIGICFPAHRAMNIQPAEALHEE